MVALSVDVGRAFVRVEDKAIDHDVCILTEGQRTIVVKGNLQPRVSSRAKPVAHVHRGANNGGRGANLCLAGDLADSAYSKFGLSTKGRTEDKEQYREEAQEKWL